MKTNWSSLRTAGGLVPAHGHGGCWLTAHKEINYPILEQLGAVSARNRRSEFTSFLLFPT